MKDRRQYTPSPTPNLVDSAWLQHEFQRLSQVLALIDAALIEIEGRLKNLEEIVFPT